MKKRTLIAILGIWVAIIPSLGLPSTWKHWVIVCSGLFITAVALKRKYIIVEEPAEAFSKDSKDQEHKNTPRKDVEQKSTEHEDQKKKLDVRPESSKATTQPITSESTE